MFHFFLELPVPLSYGYSWTVQDEENEDIDVGSADDVDVCSVDDEGVAMSDTRKQAASSGELSNHDKLWISSVSLGPSAGEKSLLYEIE